MRFGVFFCYPRFRLYKLVYPTIPFVAGSHNAQNHVNIYIPFVNTSILLEAGIILYILFLHSWLMDELMIDGNLCPVDTFAVGCLTIDDFERRRRRMIVK